MRKTNKQLAEWANNFDEKGCRALLEDLVPPSQYSFLLRFAKEQPHLFYIDDRVQIRNRRKIYAVVSRLGQIRRKTK